LQTARAFRLDFPADSAFDIDLRESFAQLSDSSHGFHDARRFFF
jgi:hypothetical protein